jgi:cell division protein YceG involved in septum cleavage
MTKTTVTDENRADVTSVYCHRLLDDMDFDTLYSFAYDMLRDNKEGLTNEMLENQIIDYYPDILEN